MKQTIDIEPLIDIATDEFQRRYNAATDAINALSYFWAKMYGPHEGLAGAQADLDAMYDEWHNEES